MSPPLGAFLLGILPLHAIMGIDVVMAAFAIVPLFFVHIPQPQRAAKSTEAAPKPSLPADVREELCYVVRWPGLLAICGMSTVVNFLVNPMPPTMLPRFPIMPWLARPDRTD